MGVANLRHLFPLTGVLFMCMWGNKEMHMTTYRTFLVNFGYATYVGPSLAQAKESAVQKGFEAVIYENDVPMLSWSPIQGWRGLII